jgi:hypothetical protein
MDCLRSERGLLPGVEAPEAALRGRAGGAAWLEPKKSRPSSESPGRVCLGGGAGALCCCCCGGGGARAVIEGSAVLARTGVGSSPNRSMTGAAADLSGAGAAEGLLLMDAFRREADRSSFAFSWTTLRGCEIVVSASVVELHCQDADNHHVVVATLTTTQSRRIGHRTIHAPSLRVILCADKVLNLATRVSVYSPSSCCNRRAGTHASAGTWPGASFASQYLQGQSQWG